MTKQSIKSSSVFTSTSSTTSLGPQTNWSSVFCRFGAGAPTGPSQSDLFNKDARFPTSLVSGFTEYSIPMFGYTEAKRTRAPFGALSELRSSLRSRTSSLEGDGRLISSTLNTDQGRMQRLEEAHPSPPHS